MKKEERERKGRVREDKGGKEGKREKKELLDVSFSKNFIHSLVCLQRDILSLTNEITLQLHYKHH